MNILLWERIDLIGVGSPPSRVNIKLACSTLGTPGGLTAGAGDGCGGGAG